MLNNPKSGWGQVRIIKCNPYNNPFLQIYVLHSVDRRLRQPKTEPPIIFSVEGEIQSNIHYLRRNGTPRCKKKIIIKPLTVQMRNVRRNKSLAPLPGIFCCCCNAFLSYEGVCCIQLKSPIPANTAGVSPQTETTREASRSPVSLARIQPYRSACWDSLQAQYASYGEELFVSRRHGHNSCVYLYVYIFFPKMVMSYNIQHFLIKQVIIPRQVSQKHEKRINMKYSMHLHI